MAYYNPFYTYGHGVVFDLVTATINNAPEWVAPDFDIAGGWALAQIPPYIPPAVSTIDLGSEPDEIPDIPINSVGGIYKAPVYTIAPPNVGTAPPFDVDDITIYEPAKPGDLSVTNPGDAPIVTAKDIPLAPDLVFPPAPDIGDVLIPPDPIITLPTFDAVAPTVDVILPQNSFSFIEEQYSSDVLDKTTSEILRMLNGGVGIPEAVWQQIFEKGADLEERNGLKLIEEATNEWASKGWASPGGVLDRRIQEARQAIQTARNTLARDTTIKRADAELENLKYAVAQGIALEGMLIQLHNSYYDRALKAAEIDMQIKLQLVNASIAILNAELDLYRVSAEVFKTLVEAELATLEIFKAQIEAAGLQVAIDKGLVDLYIAQLQGLNTEVALHNAQIAGVQAAVDVDKARVATYATEVDAYKAKVGAWATEWQGYTAVMEGQKAKASIYESEVKAFASETEAYTSKVMAESARVDAEAKSLQTGIEYMRADAQRFSAEVQLALGEVATKADLYKTQMEGYKTKAAFGSAKVQAYTAEIDAHIRNAKNASDLNTEEARINAAQIDAMSRANLAAQETYARINAQIHASLIGQYHASASVSDGVSYSYSGSAD